MAAFGSRPQRGAGRGCLPWLRAVSRGSREVLAATPTRVGTAPCNYPRCCPLRLRGWSECAAQISRRAGARSRREPVHIPAGTEEGSQRASHLPGGDPKLPGREPATRPPRVPAPLCFALFLPNKSHLGKCTQGQFSALQGSTCGSAPSARP